MSNVIAMLELIAGLPSWHQAVIWLYLATMFCCILVLPITRKLVTDVYEGEGYDWWQDDAGRPPAEGPDKGTD